MGIVSSVVVAMNGHHQKEVRRRSDIFQKSLINKRITSVVPSRNVTARYEAVRNIL